MPTAPPPIRVNRAPVLTLWATVVAERLGYPAETVLTVSRFVAGSSARAKDRRLGFSDEKQEVDEPHVGAGTCQVAIKLGSNFVNGDATRHLQGGCSACCS